MGYTATILSNYVTSPNQGAPGKPRFPMVAMLITPASTFFTATATASRPATAHRLPVAAPVTAHRRAIASLYRPYPYCRTPKLPVQTWKHQPGLISAFGASVCAAMGTDEQAAGAADTSVADANKLPALVVFDLDACLWDQEMFQLYDLVDAGNPVMGQLGDAGTGVVGAKSGGTVIRLHRGALVALQKINAGEYPGMRAAAASSADTPLAVRIGRSALDVLEVVPGVTVRQVLAKGWPAGFEGNLQIGRTPPLSSNKAATHFPRLKAFTGVPFDRMLFFDDCNWGDHCTAVRTGCTEQASGLGPATVKTPRGLQPADWENGLKTYRLQAEKL